jgi:hypothetical protein
MWLLIFLLYGSRVQHSTNGRGLSGGTFGVSHNFQRDKSHGANGLLVEFYIGYFDILGNHLLKVVEYSKTTGQTSTSFNSTFIALIPKSDNPTTFEQFKPISLCNSIYKIISKLIARRLKDILSAHISLEQFGFLGGRQIHEAIGVFDLLNKVCAPFTSAIIGPLLSRLTYPRPLIE